MHVTDPVVISGRAIATSLGVGVDQTWRALLQGKTGVRPIDAFDASGFPCRMGAVIAGIDPESMGLPRRESRIMDLHSLILMQCAQDALEDASLQGDGEGGLDIGFFAGIGMVDYRLEDLLGAVSSALNDQGGIDYGQFYARAYQEIFPLWPLSMLNNIALCQVAVKFGLKGENTVLSPHGDSTLQAIWEAADVVRNGRNRQSLVAGVGEKLSETSLARGLLHGVINTRDQETPCRPFAEDSAGTILGEGGGVVVLESRSSAEDRGKQPAVAVSGFGCGFGLPETDKAGGTPTRNAIARAMSAALQTAGRTPEDVDIVITHGEGIPGTDRSELQAIVETLGSAVSSVGIYSSKGNLGHMLAGAPLVDLVLAERMIVDGVIPPTLTRGRVLQDAEPLLVRDRAQQRSPRVVIINAFSYEGQAASLLLESLAD